MKNLDLAKQWIVKADHDLGTAKITYLHIPEYMDTVTFHCQQAVEKYLKAYLVYLKIEFKFTHDSVYLLDLVCTNDKELASCYEKIAELESYAVEVRYPNEMIFLSKEKVEQAISTATEIRKTVTTKMNISDNFNEMFDSK
jgi:HEPN domain-containing protein